LHSIHPSGVARYHFGILDFFDRCLGDRSNIDALVRIEKYGPGSEKLSDAQLELLELDPGVSSAEVAAESERAQLTLALRTASKHPGRQELPAELLRKEQIIPCTPEQWVCGKCGKETTVIGYEQSEQLNVEPAQYFVRVTKREKRACKACEEQGVRCAPLPPRIYRERPGQRSGSDRHGGQQILGSPAALSPKCHARASDRVGNLSGDFGWLGDAGGRIAPANHRGNGSRVGERHLYPSR